MVGYSVAKTLDDAQWIGGDEMKRETEVLLPFVAWAPFVVAKKYWQDSRLLLRAPLI